MSEPDEEITISPPTSPVCYSPPTSPACQPSPPTSPRQSSSSSGNESKTESPERKSLKRRPHRTTVQRKRLRYESTSSEDDSNHGGVNNLVDNEEFVNCLGAVETSCSNHLESNDRNPLEDATGSENKPDRGRENCLGGKEDSESAISDSASDSASDNGSDSASDSESCFNSSSDSLASRHSSRSDLSSDSSNSDSDGVTSADTVYSLFNGAPTSAEEGLLTVFKLFCEGNWTKVSLDSTFKAFKKTLPQPNEMPGSGRAGIKRLFSLTSTCDEVPYVYCNECLELVTTINESCDHSKEHSKFYLFPIDQQIKHMFEQRGLASVIDAYKNHSSRKPGFICDILDGTEYLKVKEHFPALYDLLALLNTDGVAMSGSSKKDLWPVMGTISEVPPRLRSSYMIVAGVYVGEKDPNMNVFLKPIIDSFKNLSEKGVSWVHPISKEQIVSRIVAPVVCADAPARAKVLQMEIHSSKFGCNICEQKAKKTQPVLLKNNKLRRLRRFLFKEEMSRLRTGVRMDRLGNKAERVSKSQKGVVRNSILSEMPFLDRGICTCAEYMHLIALGVVKYFLDIIFHKRGPWFLGDKIPEMDVFIESIKVPDYFNRLPKQISKFKYWKASDFRAFLFFYSLPLFKDRLPDRYFQHWLLLVSGIFILCKDSISENDLMIADIMLKSFVRDVKELYGEKCYVYNVHNVLHLVLLVRRWGPLWSTSAFVFESFNGYLGNLVHGTKHLGQELINNIKISQSVAILENIINSRDGHHHQFSMKVSELLGSPLLKENLTVEEEAAINSCTYFQHYVLHSRATVMSKIYTTQLYDKNVKRANSIIEFKSDGKKFYGQILYFMKTENASLYCLVQVYKTNQLELLFHENSAYVVGHLLPVVETEKLVVIPVESIITKVGKVGNYLCTMPNPYEVHL